ncbi:conserved hypothetical protein [Vibrio chagasii]|uniref:alpha/beta fold hydrolase n=1 Tax=Vibrio TaxID=662 RepID=UPI0022CD75BD|nr:MULTISPECIES: alpha/beta hydrolase [unclassified Vibrio]MDA0151644.1 alpha/beta hydrolase [Vibrio sp. Makdt]CAH6796648.1 conserved hypothetical protein [Vibrio chagasii]CAH7375853.1 conserved hypothetical protein [Vibrio chagasii]
MNVVYFSPEVSSSLLKQAVVLSPVMPVWDKGEFCLPLTQHLNQAGYCVAVIDTLSVCTTDEANTSIEEIKQAILKVSANSELLLCGFALGGALAQCVAAHLPSVSHLFSVSGPGQQTIELTTKLGELIAKLRNCELPDALAQLGQWVAPTGTFVEMIPAPAACDHELATQRMLNGFTLLRRLNSRNHLEAFKGRCLLMVGDKSQMVTASNQICIEREGYEIVSIHNAGMRPWADNPKQVAKYLTQWISL